MLRLSRFFVVWIILIGVRGDTGYFWHVTDMHWDPTYEANSAAGSCNTEDPGGYYGPYGNYLCDSPWKLINSSVYAMKEIKEDVDFLIWTGDDTPHIWDNDVLNKEVVWSIIANLTDKLEEVFPDKIVYSAIGNHDWSPKSQLPAGPDPFYDRILEKWTKVGWVSGAEANTTFSKGAYYSMKRPGSRLKMLILNTNLHYESNKLTENLVDPADHFLWLENELIDARNLNEKVIIVSHVPPGMFEKHAYKYWFYPRFNTLFIDLIKAHADVIGSMHFAHHHTDSFRILQDGENAFHSMLLGPAVTPWETTLPGVMGGTGNNPSIRLIQYDRNTGEVEDIYQYWMNLNEANRGFPKWELLYRATEYYNIPDVRTSSLHSLAKSLYEDDGMFSKYYNANGVQYDPDEKWTSDIRVVHYCSIMELDYEKYRTCYDDKIASGHRLHSMTAFVILIAISAHIFVF